MTSNTTGGRITWTDPGTTSSGWVTSSSVTTTASDVMSGKYYWTSNPISDVYSGAVLSNMTFVPVNTEITNTPTVLLGYETKGPEIPEELQASDKDIEELLYGN